MSISWVWVAQAAVYFGIAWIVATALIGVFLLGLEITPASALFRNALSANSRAVSGWSPRHREPPE